MKRVVIILSALLLGCLCQAQEAGYTPGKVAFSPVFDASFSGYSKEISDLMQNKLTQIALRNGVGSYSEQYVLTAKIALEDKQVTATAPAQYVVKLSVQLLALDMDAKVIVGEHTLPLVGVDKSENRAYMDAIRKIKPSDPLIVSFIKEASSTVVAAYNRNMETNLANARNWYESGQYEEALACLAAIPEYADNYDRVRELSSTVVKAKQQKERAQRAAAAAAAAQRAEEEAEARQREWDHQIQLEMIAAQQSKAKKTDWVDVALKVGGFLLGI